MTVLYSLSVLCVAHMYCCKDDAELRRLKGLWDGVNGAIGAVAYLFWQPSGFRPKHQPITWLV